MSMNARALTLILGISALSLCAPSGLFADAITTPTATIPLTTTNWGPGTNASVSASGDPLVLPQFNTQGGTNVLDSVTLSFQTQLQLNFILGLVTPGTAMSSVATGLANTPGPTITLFGPDGATLLVAQAPIDPSFLTQSYTSTTGSNTTVTLGPTGTDRTYTLTLTSPAQLAQFTGTGTVSLPVSATAISAISISSGNGSAEVVTSVGAGLTATYNFHQLSARQQVNPPQPAPEPGTMALWALAGAGLLCARHRRGRSARI